MRRRTPPLLLAAALVASVLPVTTATAQDAVDLDGDRVAITALRTRGPGTGGTGATDEYVEIRNLTADPVDLSGWRLQGCASGSGAASTRTTVPTDTVLPAGASYLFVNGSGGEPSADYSAGTTPDLVYSTGIADGAGAGARLLDAAGEVVSGVGGGASDCREGDPLPGTETGFPGSSADAFDFVRADDRTRDTGDNATDFAGSPVSGYVPANLAGDGGDVEEPVEPDAPSCDDPTLIQDLTTVTTSGLPGSDRLGDDVTVEAVVTADFTEGLGGIFVQEEDADAAGATSSSGIFVFRPDEVPPVGSLVCVTGTVGDFEGATQLTGSPVVTVVDEQVELPSVADLVLPVEGPQELAALAGMRVALTGQDGTLTVAQNFFQGRFGELDVSGTGLLWQPTELLRPDDPAAAELKAANRNAQIKLDDGISRQNVSPTSWFAQGARRAGAVTTDVVQGVAQYQFGSYRVQPLDRDDVTFTNVDNPRPDGPPDVTADAPTDAEAVTVAAFNVLNYFTTLGSRGAVQPEEFERQATKIVTAITEMDAEVVGLIEIENNFGSEGDALVDLVERLNERAGEERYAGIDLDAPAGSDQISNAIIYQPDAVTPVGELALAEQPAFVNPLGARTDRSRPAVAQAFETAGGETFVTVVNHLKSKGSSCAADGDPDSDLTGSCDRTRTRAVEELVRWLEEDDPTGTGSDRIVVTGDLNAYAMEDPIEVLRDAGYVDALGDQLGETYSYVFDGELGRLDHTFVSPALAEDLVGAAAWHVNADEPEALSYLRFNPDENYDDTAFRSSDHDPILAGFAFAPPAPAGPSVKDDCRGGGWRAFEDPAFRNEGRCIASVASEGRSQRAARPARPERPERGASIPRGVFG